MSPAAVDPGGSTYLLTCVNRRISTWCAGGFGESDLPRVPNSLVAGDEERICLSSPHTEPEARSWCHLPHIQERSSQQVLLPTDLHGDGPSRLSFASSARSLYAARCFSITPDQRM